jgi:hypothetical protein
MPSPYRKVAMAIASEMVGPQSRIRRIANV